jgi:hypothetical protein
MGTMIVDFVEPFVMTHLVLVGAVWAYVLVGSLAAGGVVWSRRRSGRPRARLWGSVAQLAPPLGLLLAIGRRAPAPLRSPFGEVRVLDAAGKMLPKGSVSAVRLRRFPPAREFFASLLGGLIPGGGQVVHLRIGRAIVVWSFVAFALTFISAHRLGIERTWGIPDALLPASRQGQDATANFRVPGYFYIMMLVELAAFVLWSLLDTVGLNAAHAEKHARRGEGARRVFYTLVVDRPGADSERCRAERESIAVGSAAVSDHIVAGEGVAAEHVLFYIHHVDVSALTLQFRCLTEDTTVTHNGAASHDGVLRPGDTVQVGDTSFRFLPLE